MKAKEFRNVILFMGNRWDKDEAVKVFGPNMGAHFYGKWVGACGQGVWIPDYATMRLFYEMSDQYMQVLLDYVEKNYHGC